MASRSQVKALISVAYEYHARKSEKNLTTLQRQIQILSVTSDLTIFEPTSMESLEFYICLEQLLAEDDIKSPLAWKVINLFSHMCRSASIRVALRDKIQLLPILTKVILTPKLSHDKFTKALHLLQEISYGVKISRWEGWTVQLIPNLVSFIIDSSDDLDVLEMALITLGNLCRGNAASVTILRDFSERKALMKSLTSIETRKPSLRVQLLAAEMMIHANIDCSKLEENEVSYLIDIMFAAATNGVKSRDFGLLELSMYIFEEFQHKLNLQHLLNAYGKYCDKCITLINCIGEHIGANFIDVIFKFAKIVLTRTTDSQLVSVIIQRAQSCIQNVECGKSALGIIESIVQITDVSEFTTEILGHIQDAILFASETHTPVDWLCSLLCLLKIFAQKHPTSFPSNFLDASILKKIKCDLLKKAPSNQCSEAIVMILSVTKHLGSFKAEYLVEYQELLNEIELMQHVAVCLKSCNVSIVEESMNIICNSHIPSDSMQVLVKAQASSNENDTDIQQFQYSIPSVPFSQANADNINNLISRLHGTVDKTELRDLPLTDVMELYEYKLASLAHSERALQEALNASDQQIRKLNQVILQSRSETGRLRVLLQSWENRLQDVRKEKDACESRVEEIKQSARDLRESLIKEKTSVERDLAKQQAELVNWKHLLEKREEELKRSHRQISDLQNENKNIHKSLREEQDKNKKLTGEIRKQDKEKQKMSSNFETLEKEQSRLEKTVEAQKKQNTELELLVRSHEQTLEEKENEISELTKVNASLKRIKDMIHNISSGKA